MKQEILNSKKQILDKMALMQTFKAIWAEDQQANQFKLTMEGALKGKNMQKSGLTEADWKRIASMLENTVKPIKDDIQTLKADIKAIKECPTIKKELK